jgi:23S rRNA pseudouridine1911/1915/1917 synthase
MPLDEVTWRWIVGESGESLPCRLDVFLGLKPEIGSRTKAQELIESGLVSVSGRIVTKCAWKLMGGEDVSLLAPISLAPQTEVPLRPSEKPLSVIFEDEDCLVINKPAGLVVHPSLGHNEDSVVHRLWGRTQLSSGSAPERPGVVHRLDKETSGLLVLAKTDTAHRFLADQFATKKAGRIYEAIVTGLVRPTSASIQSYLARHPTDRKRRASVRDERRRIIREQLPEGLAPGKWAVTHYEVLSFNSSCSLSYLRLRLETGRTHQIRVHLSELGYPIVGDEMYGFKAQHPVANEVSRVYPQGIFLHAKKLIFIHPSRLQEMVFEVPWPLAPYSLIQSCFLRD